jgi:gluconokinase
MSADAPLTVHRPPQAQGLVIVIMGVTGAGKTTVGQRLAETLGWSFYDADNFHPPENVAHMRAGEALTEAEREPWLDALEALIERVLSEGKRAVLACSALRAGYRDRLRRPAQKGLGEVRFVFLRISPEEAKRRVEQRKGHYMPATLVESQFETLEEPDDVLALDATRTPDELVREIRTAWQL